jgi:pyridoxal phosphate enzyme (YggS family)
MTTIGERLSGVRARIAAACERAGRDPETVALVAVSKTQDASAVRAAYDAGQRTFGENYVQELCSKARALSALEGLRWHLIGHLQRNKSREVAGVVSCVETVDSTRLADALAKHVAADRGPRLGVMIQVNVAREPQKSGIAAEELDALAAHVRAMPELELRGLMTVPPLDREPEASRPHFRALRELAQQHGLRELSMGMSSDLEVAVEEGATIVRVGTAIFGAR